MDRRKFLKKSIESAKVVSLLSLTGCAALDRYFEIEKADYSKEVLIFGGGVSGLSTAYFLKKNDIPYRIFEGSGRIGGRVLSQRFPQPLGSIEMGAHHVDSLDQDISELIKEMNLELEESSLHKNAFFFCLNKDIVPFKALVSSYPAVLKAWNKELARVRKLTDQLPIEPRDDRLIADLEAYDKIAFSDILNDSKLDFKGRFIFKNWAESQFQKKATEISFLEWLYFLERFTLSGKKMYLPGGMSQFVDILGQRVSGVIPNYNLQVNTRLIEINRSKDKWLCTIQTKEGLKKLSAPFVVLALPFNQLKTIKGIENVFTNKEFKDALSQAQFKTHFRVVFKSKEKSTRDNGTYYFFEPNKLKVFKDDLLYSIDTDQMIEVSGLTPIKNQVAQIFGIRDLEEENVYSWSQIPLIGGSEVKLGTNTLIPVKAAYFENWQRMSLQLAGDYLISPDHANLNDCVRSGLRAAKNLTALVQEKDQL